MLDLDTRSKSIIQNESGAGKANNENGKSW
jgi:hypothetical protein